VLADSNYTEIDWTVHKNRVSELTNTGFFTKTFLDNYTNIAQFLDKELKRNPIKYRMGELPPYGKDVNEWCHCKDYPSDSLTKLTISNMNKYGDSSTFKWSWGDSSSYFVTAKKENNTWRISSLEGFDLKNFYW
jgi:hypothetical protein